MGQAQTTRQIVTIEDTLIDEILPNVVYVPYKKHRHHHHHHHHRKHRDHHHCRNKQQQPVQLVAAPALPPPPLPSPPPPPQPQFVTALPPLASPHILPPVLATFDTPSKQIITISQLPATLMIPAGAVIIRDGTQVRLSTPAPEKHVLGLRFSDGTLRPLQGPNGEYLREGFEGWLWVQEAQQWKWVSKDLGKI
ncbi:hypothetical protein BDD12DRAFT_914756 [Trichophaea hybrida]|nr:hypothetical protein BDD12DRAFT_914756 [Trichophaea hybrida]